MIGPPNFRDETTPGARTAPRFSATETDMRESSYAATAQRLVELQQLVAEKRIHIAELQEQVLQILDKNNEQAKTIRRLEDLVMETRK